MEFVRASGRIVKVCRCLLYANDAENMGFRGAILDVMHHKVKSVDPSRFPNWKGLFAGAWILIAAIGVLGPVILSIQKTGLTPVVVNALVQGGATHKLGKAPKSKLERELEDALKALSDE